MLKEYFRFLCHVNNTGDLFCVKMTILNTGLLRWRVDTKEWLQRQRAKMQTKKDGEVAEEELRDLTSDFFRGVTN